MTASANPAKPVKLLVIQLARLGDSLQTLMALRAAKQLYPQLEIHLVVREKFSAAAKRIPWLAEVITFPTESLVGPVLQGRKTEQQGLGDLARWLAPLCKQPWDFVLNWTYSESSSYLTALLPARVKLGYSRRNDCTQSNNDGWSQYIQGVLQSRVEQNIHLTDILTTQLLTALQIHIGEPGEDGNAAVTSKAFFALKIGESDSRYNWNLNDYSKKWIGIQLGAGNDAKTWEPESWAAFATYALSRHPEANVVLLGGKEDEPRARRFNEAMQKTGIAPYRVVSLVGQSDFDLWAYVVSRCQWLAAGDTAAIHLASVLGTRVLNVSVGPVRWTETGPYGNGHYVIASSKPCAACAKGGTADDHSCRADVTPESVYAAWSYADRDFEHLRRAPIEDHFKTLGSERELSRIAVYRSRIRSTSDGGGVVYEPLIQRPLNMGEWSSIVLGHIARAWYCGWVPPLGQGLPRAAISPLLVQQLRKLDESSLVMAKICEEARQTATLLGGKSSRLKSEKIMKLKDRDELRELGKKLMDLDQLVERLVKTEPQLSAFENMLKVLMHNLRGEALAQISRESALCYRQLSEGVLILREWVKHTLEMAKPVAVKSPTVVAIGSGRKEIPT